MTEYHSNEPRTDRLAGQNAEVTALDLAGELTGQAGPLLAAVTEAALAAEKSVNHVLTSMRILADDGMASFTATNGELTILRNAEASGSMPAVLVNAQQLVKLAKLAWPVKRKSDREAAGILSLANGYLTITGSGGSFKLMISQAEAADQFNEVTSGLLDDPGYTITAQATDLTAALLAAGHCSVKDSIGAVHYTNGLLLVPEAGRLNLIGTDGHRLGWAKVAAEVTEVPEVRGTYGQILADWAGLAKLVRIVKKHPGQVRLAAEAKGLIAELPEAAGLVRIPLLNVKFPDWERVMPKRAEASMLVQCADLRSAAEAAITVQKAHPDYSGQNLMVRLDLDQANGYLLVSVDDQQLAALVAQPLVYSDLTDKAITINPEYLLQLAKVHAQDSYLRLNWINEVSPLGIQLALPDGQADRTGLDWLVMPIRTDC